MTALLVLAACTTSAPEAPEPAPAPAPIVAPAPEPVPAGRISAAPILEKPTILGGIDNATVAGALDLGAAAACNRAGRPGKVLVRFRIQASGVVGDVEVVATTLRHPETEACLLGLVSQAAFPPLQRGEYALVSWPFSI